MPIACVINPVIDIIVTESAQEYSATHERQKDGNYIFIGIHNYYYCHSVKHKWRKHPTASYASNTERPKSEVINEKFDKMVKFASTSLTRAKQVKQGSKYTRIVLYCINLYYGAYSTYMLHAPCLSFGYNARMSRDCTLHPLCNALHIADIVVAAPVCPPADDEL